MDLGDFQDVLNFDALSEAERITGRSYKEDPDTMSLGFAMHVLAGEAKAAELSLRDDTHMGTKFAETQRIYAELGFQTVHEHQFMDGDVENTFCVLWRPDGVLAKIESYGSSTNISELYYNWRPSPGVDAYKFTSSGSYHRASYDAGDPVWVGHHDVREGLRHKLGRLAGNGSFLPVWIGRPFLWLLDYQQSKPKDYDHKAITDSVVALLPAAVRSAITPAA